MVVVGAALLAALGLLVAAPSTFADEAVYTEFARSLGTSGQFSVLGVHLAGLTYGPAYVVLLAPIFMLISNAHDAYLVARAVDACLFATAACPVFLIARRAVSRRSSFMVAAAAIALPASMYTAKLQTESLAYPVVLWSVLAALRVIERSSLRRQLVLVLLVAFAPFVRFELIALGPVLAAACLVARRPRRSLAVTVAGVAVSVLTTLVLFRASAGPAGATSAHGFDLHALSIARFGRLTVDALGALDLYSGVLPFACFLAVAAGSMRLYAGLRSLVLLTIATAAGLLLVGNAFLASIPASYSPVPPDRYTFYVVPLFFVVFAAWLERGAPRTTATRYAALAAATLPLIVVLTRIRSGPGNTNGLAVLPWIYLRIIVGQAWIPLIAVYCLGCAWLLIDRRTNARGLVRLVVAAVAATSYCAFFFVISAGQTLRNLSPAPGWLDSHSTSGVVALWVGQPTPAAGSALWEIDMGNRNLAAVYFTRTPDWLGRGLERKVVGDASGVVLDRGRPINTRFVLAPVGTPVLGRVTATSKGFALFEIQPPLRLRTP